MDDFETSIRQLTTQYGADVSELSIALAIEAFRDVRNYPSGFDEATILSDMEKHSRKIAMAAVEIDSKDGTENQTGHSENGENRTYYQGIMAYKNVVGFAKCI